MATVQRLVSTDELEREEQRLAGVAAAHDAETKRLVDAANANADEIRRLFLVGTDEKITPHERLNADVRLAQALLDRAATWAALIRQADVHGYLKHVRSEIERRRGGRPR